MAQLPCPKEYKVRRKVTADRKKKKRKKEEEESCSKINLLARSHSHTECEGGGCILVNCMAQSPSSSGIAEVWFNKDWNWSHQNRLRLAIAKGHVYVFVCEGEGERQNRVHMCVLVAPEGGGRPFDSLTATCAKC